MALTGIGDQKTPGRPIEIVFEPETGLPSSNKELLLIGHLAASGGASGISLPYEVIEISNVASVDAASGEVATKFGDGSELAKMVLAAVRANQSGSTFPAIKCVGLNPADTDFGAADAALTAASRVKAEYIVSPYAASDQTLTGAIKDTAQLMSGAQRVENNQYGTFAVAFERDETDASNLFEYDTQFLIAIWLRDTGAGDDAPAYSIGEMAAACAARMAANLAPFNPLDSQTIDGIDAPAQISDYPTVGAGLESEIALQAGWTPLYVKPNLEVAFVRTVTTRITVNGEGVTAVTAYYDAQDFDVLYLWRKTLFTRFSQTDFKTRKASEQAARDIKSECIRLATAFQDQNMFQAVDELAKQFVVERNATDRHRFDVFTPVNVIPGLHVIATRVSASTQFDVITV